MESFANPIEISRIPLKHLPSLFYRALPSLFAAGVPAVEIPKSCPARVDMSRAPIYFSKTVIDLRKYALSNLNAASTQISTPNEHQVRATCGPISSDISSGATIETETNKGLP